MGFADGDVVAVTVDWLAVPLGAQGEIRGFAHEQPVTYHVQFAAGVFAVPAVHLVHALHTALDEPGSTRVPSGAIA